MRDLLVDIYGLFVSTIDLLSDEDATILSVDLADLAK
jgi:hypothetical protein